MTKDEHKTAQVVCPYCGYQMPAICVKKSNIFGSFARCKRPKCRRVFEVKVNNGVQERVSE